MIGSCKENKVVSTTTLMLTSSWGKRGAQSERTEWGDAVQEQHLIVLHSSSSIHPLIHTHALMLTTPLSKHPQYTAVALATTAPTDGGGGVITEHRVTRRRNNVTPWAFLPLAAIVLAWWHFPNPWLAKILVVAVVLALVSRWRVLYRECSAACSVCWAPTARPSPNHLGDRHPTWMPAASELVMVAS